MNKTRNALGLFVTIYLIITIKCNSIESQISTTPDPETNKLICFSRNDSDNKPIVIQVSEIEKFQFNCTCCRKLQMLLEMLKNFSNNLPSGFVNDTLYKDGIFAQRIIVVDKNVVIPIERKNLSPRYQVQRSSRPLFQICPFYSKCQVMYINLPSAMNHFYLDANTIGRTQLSISIIWWNISHLPRNIVEYYLDDETFEKRSIEEKNLISSSFSQRVLNEFKFNITVLRKPNPSNTAFNLSSAFIAALLALSVGCSLDLSVAKTYFKQYRCLIFGLTSQHLILPTLGITIYKMLQLKNAVGYGLFALSCSPGGGLGHIIVFLMKGDEDLSALLSTINCFMNAGFTLLWMYALNSLYQIEFSPYTMALWLGIIPIIQGIGVLVNFWSYSTAQAIMTWFTRPLLLLAGILFVTLGVYINHYAFNQINQSMLLGVLLLMLSGFLVGSISGYFSSGKQSKDVTCSLSVETALSNGLILIPALRYSLYQPEADLASSACLWSIFFSPLPLFLIYLSKKVQIVLLSFVKTQFKKKAGIRRINLQKQSSKNKESGSVTKLNDGNQISFKEEFF